MFFRNGLPSGVPGQPAWNESSPVSGYPAFQAGAGCGPFRVRQGSCVVFTGASATLHVTEAFHLHVTEAFQAPQAPGVRVTDVSGVRTGGSGGLDLVVNGTGGPSPPRTPGTVVPVDVASYAG